MRWLGVPVPVLALLALLALASPAGAAPSLTDLALGDGNVLRLTATDAAGNRSRTVVLAFTKR